MGYKYETDAKGNLITRLGTSKQPKIVVTAHMDEIAMIVRRIEPDGRLVVGALGGLYPWKIGEGPLQILAETGPIDAVLCFGSIHTDDPISNVRRAEAGPLDWEMARVMMGLTCEELREVGIRPGTRVVVSPSRRKLVPLGELVAGFFLDDRADLVAWLLALEELKGEEADVLFAATTSEEVGGEGAKYMLQNLRPEVCIALELGPYVRDAPVRLSDQPTVWVTDSYSTMAATDVELIERIGHDLGLKLQFQALSRGGSDASASANQGLCARPFTLGIAMENSHGFEIIAPGAMIELGRLTAALVRELSG
jgi:putative aminopeptidase FrvX